MHKAIKPDCKFFYGAVFFTFQHFICSPTVSTDSSSSGVDFKGNAVLDLKKDTNKCGLYL